MRICEIHEVVVIKCSHLKNIWKEVDSKGMCLVGTVCWDPPWWGDIQFAACNTCAPMGLVMAWSYLPASGLRYRQWCSIDARKQSGFVRTGVRFYQMNRLEVSLPTLHQKAWKWTLLTNVCTRFRFQNNRSKVCLYVWALKSWFESWRGVVGGTSLGGERINFRF